MLAKLDQTDLDAIELMMNKFLEVKNQEISAATNTTKETLEEKIQMSSASPDLKEKRA